MEEAHAASRAFCPSGCARGLSEVGRCVEEKVLLAADGYRRSEIRGKLPNLQGSKGNTSGQCVVEERAIHSSDASTTVGPGGTDQTNHKKWKQYGVDGN